MRDDGACNMNDLPKVTSIISSEPMTKTDAFDMMVRFLSKHQFRYRNNINNNNSQQDLQPEQQFGHVYHFWEDLYHVTETLVTVQSDRISLDSRQQETLRKLRLVATPASTEEVVNNSRIDSIKSEAHSEGDDDARQSRNIHENAPSDNNIVTVKEEEFDSKQQQKISKKDKKEKKKEKKRKRESA